MKGQKREAVVLMCDATGLSQRRACWFTGLSLSTCRYDAQRPTADAHLSGRISGLALERRRFGYRRILQLLVREGLHVNHKRVYQIYHLNGLSVKCRRRRKGLATEQFPLLRPDAPNVTWSMDFVMDALANGRRIKCLTCVDDFTKECLTITGTAIFFMPGKRLMAGGRIITGVVLIHRWITRHQLNSHRTGETGSMKKNQPTLLTEGCI